MGHRCRKQRTENDASFQLTPIDLRFPFLPYDQKLVLRALEYVRLNLFEILPRLQRSAEAVVALCGTAHDTAPVPLLLLDTPVDDGWDVLEVLDALQRWVDDQEPETLRRAAEATPLPRDVGA